MRCRNCGWENPDTNTCCEKCGAPIDASSAIQIPVSEPVQSAPMSGTASPLRSTVRESEVFSAAINNAAAQPQQQSQPQECPCCHYPISPGTTVCPACGTSIASVNTNQQAQPQPAVQPQYNSMNARPTVNENFAGGKHCTNCGALIAPNMRFCASCGAPVEGAQPQAQSQPKPRKPYGGTVASFSGPGSMGMGNFCTLKPIAWERERIEYQPVSYTGERIILNRANTDANNQTITSHEQASLTCKDGEWYLEDLSANHSTMIRVMRPVKLESGDIIMLGNRMFEFND